MHLGHFMIRWSAPILYHKWSIVRELLSASCIWYEHLLVIAYRDVGLYNTMSVQIDLKICQWSTCIQIGGLLTQQGKGLLLEF